MASGDIHTIPYGASWANRVEAHPQPFNIHDTLAMAVEEACALARQRGVSHLIHNPDGSLDPPRVTGNRL